MIRRIPFLRWIGGKRRVAPHLIRLVPKFCAEGVYREPFVGAASMYLRLAPERAVLGDINPDLIAFYSRVKSRPDLLDRYLQEWRGPFTRERYLLAREKFNKLSDGYRKSALFLVLNKTCFNGIWRVSRSGKFNVPFGNKVSPELPSGPDLHSYAEAFTSASLLEGDFEAQLSEASPADFVYLDPPYPPINGTSFFAHYTTARFSYDDQVRVAREARRLAQLGCRVLISNAGVPRVLNLYSGFRVEIMPTTRYVAAGGVRHRVDDVAIMNYNQRGDVIDTDRKADTVSPDTGSAT